MNILMAGNSHSACRYKSKETFNELQNVTISWICQGGNINTFKVDKITRKIYPRFNRITSSIIQVYEKNGIRINEDMLADDSGFIISELDVIVLTSIGVTSPTVIGSEHITHHMNNFNTTTALIKDWLSEVANIKVALKLVSELRDSEYNGRIFITPMIRPIMLPEFCTISVWEKFCTLEYNFIKESFSNYSAETLPYPPGTDILTPKHLTLGKNSTHGDEQYGHLINSELCKSL